MTRSLLAEVGRCLESHGIRWGLIGATALAIHGVSRSTLDQDLLVADRRVLDPETWSELSSSIAIDIRRGDSDDPLAGIVRITAAGARDVDVVVGRHRWQAEIVERARMTRTPDGDIPVVEAADLVLLKLYAAGPQDLWDIQQLRLANDAVPLDREVESRLDPLPAACRQAWIDLLKPR
jgi:hypothetical protein